MNKERLHPKIALIGKTGQVGQDLAPLLTQLRDLASLDRRQLGLANPDEIRRVIRAASPDLIVNAAAYPAADRAESEPEVAWAINAAI
jgi:dTDP-4-dehydrorhamnose reductase